MYIIKLQGKQIGHMEMEEIIITKLRVRVFKIFDLNKNIHYNETNRSLHYTYEGSFYDKIIQASKRCN